MVIGLFYGVPLLLLVAMNLRPKARVNYVVFDEFYDQSNPHLQTQIEEIFSYLKEDAKEPNARFTGLEHAIRVRRIAIDFIEKIETIKSRITRQANKTDSKGFKLELWKEDPIQTYFTKRRGADSLQDLINGSLSNLVGQLPERDSAKIVDFLVRIWLSQQPISYGWSSMPESLPRDWCGTLFANQNVHSASLMLSMLQSKMLSIELFMLTRVYEVYRMRTCGFGTDGVVEVAQPTLLPVGATARCNILYADFAPPHTVLEFYVGNRALRVDYRVAIWQQRATRIGLNTVKGTAILRKGDSARIYPWSFNYFVATPVAIPSLDSMNIIYRDVPCTTTLSMPGYKSRQLSLRVPGAFVKKMGDGRFAITATKASGQAVTAYTDATNPQGVTMTANVVKLTVKDPPGPLCYLNGLANDTLTAAALTSHAQLSLRCRNEDLDIPYHLVQYSLIIRKPDGTLLGAFTATTPILNNDATLAPILSGLSPGDRLTIYDIIATWKGRHYDVAPISITIR